MNQSTYQKFLQSRGLGKVLDNKVGKVGIKVGNIVKKLKPDIRKITDDLFGSPTKNRKQREQGIKNNRNFSGY